MHIQGPSGNISAKQDDRMIIKASGTYLAEAETSDIFVEVGLLTDQSGGAFVELPNNLSDSGTATLRPSIETALHAVMPHRFVLHTHSVHALAHGVRADPERGIAKLFPSRTDVALVDYARPGQALATATVAALQAQSNLNVLLLKNHGLVIGSETVDGLRNLLGEVNCLLTINRTVVRSSVENAVGSESRWDANCSPVRIEVVERMALSPQFEMLAATWPLFPDQAVFLGPTIEVDCDTIRTKFFTVQKGRGVCSSRYIPQSALEQLVCLAEVLDRQDGSCSLVGIGESEASELASWTSEVLRLERNHVQY